MLSVTNYSFAERRKKVINAKMPSFVCRVRVCAVVHYDLIIRYMTV